MPQRIVAALLQAVTSCSAKSKFGGSDADMQCAAGIEFLRVCALGWDAGIQITLAERCRTCCPISRAGRCRSRSRNEH